MGNTESWRAAIDPARQRVEAGVKGESKHVGEVGTSWERQTKAIEKRRYGEEAD